jgi:glycosyltransferase involved in cell wall biosynthesis
VFSEHQKNTIINQYKLQEEKVIIVPNGVSDNFFINKKRDLRKKPNLLYVGRLGVQKNLDFLLNSLDGISDIITTTIVGDGDEETRLRALCKKLRLQNIDFAGRADGDSLINYYRKADIFVLPSEREGMPLVLLEAMASRLPIIGSDVIGIRELIVDGYNGRLVELNNIDKMRNAIISVINNPSDYTRISNNAYDFVNKYQWKSVAEKFDNEVY